MWYFILFHYLWTFLIIQTSLKHEGKRKVHKFRTNHIELEIEQEVTFNVDGEKLTNNKFIIDILPKAITVYNDNEFVEQIIKE